MKNKIEILDVIGMKFSYLILKELDMNINGLKNRDIHYGITECPGSTSLTLKKLMGKNLIKKIEVRYYITRKGKDILSHLESILKIDESKYLDLIESKIISEN